MTPIENTEDDALHYLNVYAVTRHWGGADEGGWWFNSGQPLASIPFTSEAEARENIPKYEEMFSSTAEGDIYSVNGGVAVHVYLEEDIAKFFPETRPHYE